MSKEIQPIIFFDTPFHSMNEGGGAAHEVASKNKEAEAETTTALDNRLSIVITSTFFVC